ncbi:phosphotransferase [Gordonia sp. PDNC005]|uniref:phosphotransferase n=1 Tax=unclassified Gordonia (in: high G+C Gram-positive bacteria) TaxID=2657482 RepID=UPI001966CAE2|nr:phosphotransferase [Gordonia sp. PDNC005]QRY62345.1 phosphotransferase [Gordonia sp. PDNC005]
MGGTGAASGDGAGALKWLKGNLYEPEHPTLVWGEARMPNILYTPQLSVAGVLDWEMAYLGHHEADLAWLLFLDWACSDFEGHASLPGTP